MDEGNLAILVDAKTEYTDQLVNIISPNIFVGIKNIYNECNKLYTGSDVLYEFQLHLSEIPKWNQEVINTEYETLIKVSKCDWLEDLLTAVFVSHTRILTSINFNKNKNKINLKIPKVDHFIHLCYIEVARNFWKNPYLFDDTISKFEYQRNRRDAERIIENTINETIRKQLPVKHILKEYLGSEFKESVNNEIDNTDNTDDIEHENLRKMVKAEIENCSKEKLDKLNINSFGDDSIDSKNTLTESISIVEPDPVNADTVNADPVKADTVKADPVNADTVNAEPVNADPVNAETVKAETVNADPVNADPVNTGPVLSDEEIEVENVINNEVNSLKLDSFNDNELKIEDLNLNIDDDLSNLEEVYITNQVSESPNIVELEETIPDVDPIIQKVEPIIPENNESKIKTVYIDTNEKKRKSSFNETDIEINYNDSEDDSYKSRKYSKKDFNFFE
mgnify:CR=1 FL=1